MFVLQWVLNVINDDDDDNCGKRAATWMESGANMQSDKFEVALSGGLTMMMIPGHLDD